MSDIANNLKFYSNIYKNDPHWTLEADMDHLYNYAITILNLDSSINKSVNTINNLNNNITTTNDTIKNMHFDEQFPNIEKFKNEEKLRLKLEEQEEISSKLSSNRFSCYLFGSIFILGLIGVLVIVGLLLFSEDKNLITVDESFVKYIRVIILIVSGFFTILGGILMIPKKESDIIREVKAKYTNKRNSNYEIQDLSSKHLAEVTKRYELFKQSMNCLKNKLASLKNSLKDEQSFLNKCKNELKTLVCPIDLKFNDLGCMHEIIELVQSKAVTSVYGSFQCIDRLNEYLKIRKVNTKIDQCFNVLNNRIDYETTRIDALDDRVSDLSDEINSLNDSINSVYSYIDSSTSQLSYELLDMEQKYQDIISSMS